MEDGGETSTPVAECLTALAIVRKGRGDAREAARLFDRALAVEEKVSPRSDAVLETRSELANLLVESSGDYARALELHTRNLVDLRASYGETHPYVALGLNNLARAEDDFGRKAEADRHEREALALQRRIYSGPHPDTAITLHNLGYFLMTQGELAEAEALTREALAMRRAVLPADHPDLALAINNLGVIVKRQGRLDGAEGLYREALELTRHALGNDHPDVTLCLVNLGGVYRDRGEFSKAEPLLADALARDRRAFLSPNVALARDMTSLAETKAGLRKYAEAEALLKEASEVLGKTGVPPDHDARAEVQEALSELLIRTGRTDEARTAIEAALKTFAGKPKARAGFEKIQATLPLQ